LRTEPRSSRKKSADHASWNGSCSGPLRPLFFAIASAVTFSGLSAANVAQAALESCGGVFVEGGASCRFVPAHEDCETQCQVTSVEQSCAATLYTQCEPSCTATASTVCTETCSPVCTELCVTVPLETSNGMCRSDCAHDCNAKCATAANTGQCHAACSHTCNANCENHCRDDDSEEVCETKCGKVCTGSCSAQANTTCQIDCQTTSFQSCETSVVETCRTDCRDKGGAIFCDGQFLNAANLQDCAAELAAEISIQVNIDVDIDADVDVDTDSDGDDDIRCAAAPPSGGSTGALPLALLGAAVVSGIVRRVRRARTGES
jgi:hypothetical protein